MIKIKITFTEEVTAAYRFRDVTEKDEIIKGHLREAALKNIKLQLAHFATLSDGDLLEFCKEVKIE